MSEEIALRSSRINVRLDAERGVFELYDRDDYAAIASAAFGVVLTDSKPISSRDGITELDARSGDASEFQDSITGVVRAEGGLSLRILITLYRSTPYAVIECELRNDGATPIQVAKFDVMQGGLVNLGSPRLTWRFYKHGWQSWSPTLVLDCSGEDIPMAAPVIAPGIRPEEREGRFASEMMTAIVSPSSGQGIVAGFITAVDQMSQLWLDREGGGLTAASYADGITVPPGGRLSSERLLIEPTRAPLEAMERYGDALGRKMGARPSDHVASGWCSWYHYWHGVSEEAVLANLEELRRRRQKLPLEYVQIDDGWQGEIGDWLEVNEKFPRGMKWLVERIHKAGFKAGLWLAPFLMGEKSRLWKEHPEWAVQYRPGKPFIAMQNWGQDCYALDLTRPEVIEWLKTVFRTICEEWDFDYVKIDFIYAGAVDRIRHNPEMTRAQAYRRGLEAIREAVGERFILGCGNPMGASVGLVDAARISPDVAPYWHPPGQTRDSKRSRMSEPSALNAIRNSITRWWMHGRLWENDPDCALVRDIETALTADEVRTLTTVIAMSGGMVLDSDDFTRLSNERREWLAILVPPYGRAARPLDLFESEIPRLLELDLGSHWMLALFNWDEEPATIEAPLPVELVRVFDAWSREDLGIAVGSMKHGLPAHGCRLLALRMKGAQEAQDESALPPLFRWSRFEAL
jgi:alpha-galactosidase